MDEPREGTVLFLVNYLPGVFNWRALYYNWFESSIDRAPSPPVTPSPMYRQAVTFCVCYYSGQPGACGQGLSWVLKPLSCWKGASRAPLPGNTGQTFQVQLGWDIVGLWPVLQAQGAPCVLACMCTHMHCMLLSVLFCLCLYDCAVHPLSLSLSLCLSACWSLSSTSVWGGHFASLFLSY
jgi:hypothetical protein